MFTTVYICVLICDIYCFLLVCTLQIFHFPAQLVVFVGAGLHPVVRQQNCRVSDRTRHLMNPYSMLHVFVFLVIVISFLFKQEYSRCNLKTPFKTGVLTKTEAYKVLNKRKMLRMFSKVRKQKCLYVRFRGRRLTSSPECPCTLSSSCDSPERKSKTDGERECEDLKMFREIWCWSCSRHNVQVDFHLNICQLEWRWLWFHRYTVVPYFWSSCGSSSAPSPRLWWAAAWWGPGNLQPPASGAPPPSASTGPTPAASTPKHRDSDWLWCIKMFMHLDFFLDLR